MRGSLAGSDLLGDSKDLVGDAAFALTVFGVFGVFGGWGRGASACGGLSGGWGDRCSSLLDSGVV